MQSIGIRWSMRTGNNNAEYKHELEYENRE